MVRPSISIPLANVPGRGLAASAYGSTMMSGSCMGAVGPVALEYLYDLQSGPAVLQTLIVHVFAPAEPNSVPSAHGLSAANLTNHGLAEPLFRTHVTLRLALVWCFCSAGMITPSSPTCHSFVWLY